MKINVGKTDRTVRILVGIGLLAGFFFSGGSVRWIGLLGGIALITGIIGTCPLYSLTGITTNNEPKDT